MVVCDCHAQRESARLRLTRSEVAGISIGISICQLPAELVLRILAYACEDAFVEDASDRPWVDDHMRSVWNVQSVCRRWKDIVEHNPETFRRLQRRACYLSE